MKQIVITIKADIECDYLSTDDESVAQAMNSAYIHGAMDVLVSKAVGQIENDLQDVMISVKNIESETKVL